MFGLLFTDVSSSASVTQCRYYRIIKYDELTKKRKEAVLAYLRYCPSICVVTSENHEKA